jgi:uracil-DNA glycosylase family 4
VSFAPKPEGCLGCPTKGWGCGFVPPEGPSDATFLFLGQGPGEDEAHHSRPFFPDAQAGWRLTQWIYQAQLQRTDVLIGNTVQCWLPEGRKNGQPWGNRDPVRAEIQWCWNAHVGPWAHGWHTRKCIPPGSPHHILPVGVPAAKWILALPWSRGGERYAGTSQRISLPPIGVNHVDR